MRRLIVTTALVLFAAAAGSLPVSAQDGSTVSPEQELVEQYAPIMMLKAQDGPCDSEGEPYAPQSVDIVLDNPDVVLRQVGNDDPVLATAPSAADLYGLSEGFYLDFPGSAFEPGCIYEQDFDRYTGTVTGQRLSLIHI